jgi:hypothetical protein
MEPSIGFGSVHLLLYHILLLPPRRLCRTWASIDRSGRHDHCSRAQLGVRPVVLAFSFVWWNIDPSPAVGRSWFFFSYQP